MLRDMCVGLLYAQAMIMLFYVETVVLASGCIVTNVDFLKSLLSVVQVVQQTCMYH